MKYIRTYENLLITEELICMPSGEVIEVDIYLLELIIANRKEVSIDYDKRLSSYTMPDKQRSVLLEIIDYFESGGGNVKDRRNKPSGSPRSSQIGFK